MAKKQRSKLDKVNVPEMFFQQFLDDVPVGESSIIDKLREITPTARGRGCTRVVEEISEDEWNDLYQRAAAVRALIKGADRSTELRPALCAKAMANRMETLGVADPVPYETNYQRKKREEAEAATSVVHDVADDDVVEDNDTDVVPDDVAAFISGTPPQLDTADDLPELDDEELDRIHKNISRS